MNTKKIILLFLVFLYHTLHAQLLIKEDFKNVFVYENSYKLISHELSKENENIIKTFEIDVLNQGEYYIYAWIFGNEKSKKINVNFGKSRSNSFDFENDQSNWHFAKIINKRELKENFYFDKGGNNISFTTSIPEVPQIEFIVLSKNLLPPESLYDKYVDSLQSNPFVDAKANNFNKLLNDDPPFESNPVYDYDYRMNITYSYSYWTTFYFYAGTNVTFETKKPNPYGSDPVMYLCCGTYPIDASWADDDDGAGYQSKISTTIPKNGFYYLIVRSYSPNAGQTSDLWVNGSLYAPNIPLNGYYTASNHNTTEELNYFTCYNSTGDPRLWIECYNLTHNRLLWWNDNFEGGDDYDWLLNARVKKAFDSSNPVTGVLLTSSSYYPTGTCDLYMGCKNASFSSSSFPNLQAIDAIQSAPASEYYNCYSWAGGVTNEFIIPNNPDEGFGWHVPGNETASFDNYFGNKDINGNPLPRYNGAINYTRMGATTGNSIIDMWGIDNPSGFSYTHASIRKPGNNHMHGYDWESKNGNDPRFFHPRYAIGGSGIGSIRNYYIPEGTYSLVTQSGEVLNVIGDGITMEESMAKGLTVVDVVNFDTSEQLFLDSIINKMPDKKYLAITSTTLENDIQEKNNHKNLLNFCKENLSETLSLMMKRYDEGENYLVYLINDLLLPEYENIRQKVFEATINISSSWSVAIGAILRPERWFDRR